MYSGPGPSSVAEERRSRFFHVPQSASQPYVQQQQQQPQLQPQPVPEPLPASAPFSQLAQAYLRKGKVQDHAPQWSNPYSKAPLSFASFSSYKAHAAWVETLTPLPQTDMETLERLYRYHTTRNVVSKMKGQGTLTEKPRQRKRRKKAKKAKAPASDDMSEDEKEKVPDDETVFVQYFPGTDKEYCEEVISLPRPTPTFSLDLVQQPELEDMLDRTRGPITRSAIRLAASTSSTNNSLACASLSPPMDSQQAAEQRETSKKFFAAALQRRTHGKSIYQPRSGQVSSLYFTPSS